MNRYVVMQHVCLKLQISSVPERVLFLIVTLFAAGLAMAAATRVSKRLFDRYNLGDFSIAMTLVRALVIVCAAYFIGENVFRLELGGLLRALGITTLVVSLGLQDLIKNVVAGVQIVVTKLVSVGDHVEIGDMRGEVMDVSLHQVIVRDKDNNSHVIPNAKLIEGSFKRLEGKMRRRYIFTCDIKPGLDLARVAEDIERLADETLDEQGWRAEEHTEVRYLGSTGNGVIASVRIFLKDVELTTPAMNAVMRAIGQRGYLADLTIESPGHAAWR